MTLFNRKTLDRHIRASPLPADHLGALEAWSEMITSGRIYGLSEVALHGPDAPHSRSLPGGAGAEADDGAQGVVGAARLRRLPGRGEKSVQGRRSVAERSAWEDWIARDRAEIVRLSAGIAAAEARIDGIVHDLFGLTPAETALLEASL
jgi:hypothetical protein